MLEFFFDCSSPWTYIAFHNVQRMAAELEEPVHWRPMLVGGVFNSVNPSVYAMRENPVRAKMTYMLKDIQDWAREADLKIVMPPKVFPVNSVKAMRGCLWLAPRGLLVPFATAVFETYWGREEDISQEAVLRDICQRIGIDSDELLTGITQPDIKQSLKANTEEVIRRGGFGSPMIYVDDDMYFGNDRLALVKTALLRKRSGAS
ncbi:MAG: 2-hydroxychromene-2-carboxylate isomerase [Rhodoferax sp.]|jgi:2-hydroxychromene-2-carboxylate isomerase